MDVATAATYFDSAEVLDAYSSAVLFTGQLDLYDAAERDSDTGWRRTVSAPTVVLPARGCVSVAGEVFVAGRVIKDHFQGEVHRQHLLLHPADGLFTYGTTGQMLAVSGTTDFYAGISWAKESRDAELTSETIPMFRVYYFEAEDVPSAALIKDAEGNYYRVASSSLQTGGLQRLTAFGLGPAAIHTAQYSATGGTYDPVADSSGAAGPIPVSVLKEPARTHYRYQTNAALDFAPADVLLSALTASLGGVPEPESTFDIEGITYRVLERWAAADGCTEMHARPR